MTAPERFARRAGSALVRRVWRVGAIAWRAAQKFDETDGEQRAASFAYYAFFSMFPLILLLITIGTTFLGPKADAASKIIAYVSTQIPLEEQDMKTVISTIDGVVASRKIDSVQTIIRCSYDPNDKSVTPAGIGEKLYTLKTSALQYQIRFENTGNDTAYHVVIQEIGRAHV